MGIARAAASASGLQAAMDAVHYHSQRWAWTLNTAKTPVDVVAFGPAALRLHDRTHVLCNQNSFWGQPR